MRYFAAVLAVVTSLVVAPVATHAATNGFQLQRHEPTPAGTLFFGVEHPWSSSDRTLAASLTLDFTQNALTFRHLDDDFVWRSTDVVKSALSAHVDVAAAFFDRLLVSASFPVVLTESGDAAFGVGPIDGAAFGDPRFGVMARLWGHTSEDAFSLHLGAYLWAPIGAEGDHAGDEAVRVQPKLAMAGTHDWLKWSTTFAWLYREHARVGIGQGPTANTADSELQAGLALAYANDEFLVGPEITLATFANSHAFDRQATALDMLLGFQYLGVEDWQLGVGLGGGVFELSGTPDFRALIRVAYAPDEPYGCCSEDDLDADGDGDGVVDALDQCPAVPELINGVDDADGCPEADTDGDGLVDPVDRCPAKPELVNGIDDDDGCPEIDDDGDGLFAPADRCPQAAEDLDGFEDGDGCPDPDNDGDGIADADDAAPNEPETVNGYQDDDGAPDSIPEALAAFSGRIEGVRFKLAGAELTPAAKTVLDGAAATLAEFPDVRVEIQGHTDTLGKRDYNVDLSRKRAESVKRYLVARGVAAERLEAVGFGPDKPLDPSGTNAAHKVNRRVEFLILK